MQDHDSRAQAMSRSYRHCGFLHGDSSRAVVARRYRVAGAPFAIAKTIGDRRVQGMQTEPGVGQVVGDLRDGPVVVVVEVSASREDFDRLEAVGSDLYQVIPVQPGAMIEMGGNPERHRKQTVYQPRSWPGKLATDRGGARTCREATAAPG